MEHNIDLSIEKSIKRESTINRSVESTTTPKYTPTPALSSQQQSEDNQIVNQILDDLREVSRVKKHKYHKKKQEYDGSSQTPSTPNEYRDKKSVKKLVNQVFEDVVDVKTMENTELNRHTPPLIHTPNQSKHSIRKISSLNDDYDDENDEKLDVQVFHEYHDDLNERVIRIKERPKVRFGKLNLIILNAFIFTRGKIQF